MVCRVAPLVLLWQATSCSLGTHEAGMLNKKNKFAHRAPRAEKPPTTRRAIQNVASRRQVRHPFDKRLQQAAAAWEGYSPGVAPDIVMTSSLLWDVARIHGSQPALLQDPAGLPLAVLRSWAVNYTGVLAFAVRAFPQVGPRRFNSFRHPSCPSLVLGLSCVLTGVVETDLLGAVLCHSMTGREV